MPNLVEHMPCKTIECNQGFSAQDTQSEGNMSVLGHTVALPQARAAYRQYATGNRITQALQEGILHTAYNRSVVKVSSAGHHRCTTLPLHAQQ